MAEESEKVAGLRLVLGIRPIITLKQERYFQAEYRGSKRKSIDKVIALLLDYLKETGAHEQLPFYHWLWLTVKRRFYLRTRCLQLSEPGV